MRELQPVNQNVIVEIATDKELKKNSGLIIPETAREMPDSARVVWMSVIENAVIRPGDMVLFKKFSGTEIEFEGKKFLVVPYSDILARVVETEAI